MQDDSRPSMIACIPNSETDSPRSSYTFVEYTRESVVVPTMTAVSMVESRAMIDKSPPRTDQYRSSAPASSIDWYEQCCF